jgi:hypothetical protein
MHRTPLAAALTALGYPLAPATMATTATRGGGPPFQLFGRIPLYRWGAALTWAERRLTSPRSSSSEADVRSTPPNREMPPGPEGPERQ